MLVNNIKKSKSNVWVEDIKKGALFSNTSSSMCDILIVEDRDNYLKAVNLNLFMIMNSMDTSCKESICEYLNKYNYYKVEAEIVSN